MIKRIKLFFILILIFLVQLGSLSSIVEANDEKELEKKIESYQEQQKKIQRESDEANNELDRLQEEMMKAYDEFQKLDEQAEETNKLINEKEIEIDKTEDRIDKLQIEKIELEERIAQRDELLKDRVRSMYQSGGNINYIEVILGAKNFGNLIERVIGLATITQQDRNILEQHIADIEALEITEDNLATEITSLEEQLKELELLLEEIEEQLQDKENIVGKLEKQQIDVEDFIVSNEEESEILKNQETAAKNELKQLENKEGQGQQTDQPKSRSIVDSNYNSSSTLMWPTNGRTITSPFGQRTHPVYGTKEFHSGIDISRNGGTDIVAAEGGTVIEARYMRGYGNTIMLSHVIGDQTITTLYAHLNTINVSVGQQVQRGEKIAVMGTTGVSTGVHLHFEVHEGGWNGQKLNRVNPLDYLN